MAELRVGARLAVSSQVARRLVEARLVEARLVEAPVVEARLVEALEAPRSARHAQLAPR